MTDYKAWESFNVDEALLQAEENHTREEFGGKISKLLQHDDRHIQDLESDTLQAVEAIRSKAAVAMLKKSKAKRRGSLKTAEDSPAEATFDIDVPNECIKEDTDLKAHSAFSDALSKYVKLVAALRRPSAEYDRSREQHEASLNAIMQLGTLTMHASVIGPESKVDTADAIKGLTLKLMQCTLQSAINVQDFAWAAEACRFLLRESPVTTESTNLTASYWLLRSLALLGMGNVYLANLQAREAKGVCPNFPGLQDILSFLDWAELLQAKFLRKMSTQNLTLLEVVKGLRKANICVKFDHAAQSLDVLVGCSLDKTRPLPHGKAVSLSNIQMSAFVDYWEEYLLCAKVVSPVTTSGNSLGRESGGSDVTLSSSIFDSFTITTEGSRGKGLELEKAEHSTTSLTSESLYVSDIIRHDPDAALDIEEEEVCAASLGPLVEELLPARPGETSAVAVGVGNEERKEMPQGVPPTEAAVSLRKTSLTPRHFAAAISASIDDNAKGEVSARELQSKLANVARELFYEGQELYLESLYKSAGSKYLAAVAIAEVAVLLAEGDDSPTTKPNTAAMTAEDSQATAPENLTANAGHSPTEVCLASPRQNVSGGGSSSSLRSLQSTALVNAAMCISFIHRSLRKAAALMPEKTDSNRRTLSIISIEDLANTSPDGLCDLAMPSPTRFGCMREPGPNHEPGLELDEIILRLAKARALENLERSTAALMELQQVQLLVARVALKLRSAEPLVEACSPTSSPDTVISARTLSTVEIQGDLASCSSIVLQYPSRFQYTQRYLAGISLPCTIREGRDEQQISDSNTHPKQSLVDFLATCETHVSAEIQRVSNRIRRLGN